MRQVPRELFLGHEVGRAIHGDFAGNFCLPAAKDILLNHQGNRVRGNFAAIVHSPRFPMAHG